MKNREEIYRREVSRRCKVCGIVFILSVFGFWSRGMGSEGRGLILNEDNSHFLASRPAEKMTVEGLQEFVDQYAGTQVTHLFFCPNSMRVNYASKVRASIWEGNDPEHAQVSTEKGWIPNRWVHNAWLLDQKGLDLYGIWIARSREKGISPWLSMRMNDIHNVNDMSNYMHDPFWKEHPEYWRVPGSLEHPGNWRYRALDYGRAEVRDHAMALIREMLQRYDVDGLELDWMRFGSHFRPGHEAEGRMLLIAFMRQVRALTKEWSEKRGHSIGVSARVPAVPEYARGLGMDGAAWAKEGLVDILVLTPFWETADFDIPVEQWRELLGAAAEKVTLAAGMELRIIGYPGQKPAIMNTADMMRGFTAAMLHRGADQIYLFNHMDSDTTVEKASDYRDILMEAGKLETVRGKPRRHVLTFHDTAPDGVERPIVLPKKLKPWEYAYFRLYTGPKPTEGKVILRGGLSEVEGYEQAKIFARVNSVDCTALADVSDPKTVCPCKRVVQFEVPPEAMQEGYNLAEFYIEEKPTQGIEWVEFYIQPQ